MTIKWNPDVKSQLEQIFQYGKIAFGIREANHIIQSINQRITLLKTFPLMGPIEADYSNNEFPYRYIIEKHYKIYYAVYPDYIYIALIWDTRQDPQKLRIYL